MSRIRGIPHNAVETARDLRRRGTPAEDVLWTFLRNRRLNGLKFRRQHTLGPFIVDFCCPAQRLIVELDGAIHDNQREQDDARSQHLAVYGYSVIRFDNLEVVNRIDYVLERIVAVAEGEG
jgi:very-short-patch-repair endonuclease